ncbi:CpaE family protein [Paenibacillus sp. GCM10027628]|uniref:AAA family ATPase n=1 Tax=Paenibacillus sp. GCM10027628 TaxID=3273413 RepID=UPI0036304463
MSVEEKAFVEQVRNKRGEMIAICSAKGGIGKTAMAVNLAVALSKNNSKSSHSQICIMDADFQFGDVGLSMDLHSTFTIKDVMESIDTMDQHTLLSYLIKHSSGVKVLAAPDRPEYADLVFPDRLDKVCDLLLSQHDYVIVDTPSGFSDKTLQIIEKADSVFMVTTLEMAAIKSTKLMLETLILLGLRDKIKLLVNRSTMDSVIKAPDVPDLLGEDMPFYVPNEWEVVSHSLNSGVPFVLKNGKSDIAKAVCKIAEQLIQRREISVFQPKQTSFIQSIIQRALGGHSSMF